MQEKGSLALEERGRNPRWFSGDLECELDFERQQVNIGLGAWGKRRVSWKLDKRD